MALTKTLLPTGIISGGPEWCLQPLLDASGAWPGDPPPYTYNECANATRNTVSSDFLTICCDGDIKDSSQAMFLFKGPLINYPLDLTNLVCCRKGAGQLLPGGLQPIPEDGGHVSCYPGEVRTPLVSLAATNTENAEIYLATYESASAGTADWTRREGPSCLWVQTTHPEVTGRLAEVEVPVAQITALPRLTTDMYGNPVVATGTGTGGQARLTESSTWERTTLSGSGVTGSVYKGGGQVWGSSGGTGTTPTGDGAGAASTSTGTRTSSASKLVDKMAATMMFGLAVFSLRWVV